MDQELEAILYRIISGYYYIYINDITYKVILPNLQLKNEAYRASLCVIEDNKYDITSWISKKAIDNLLSIYDLWDSSKEDLLQKSIKDLDKLKIELYLNFTNESYKKNIKSAIQSLNNNINILYSKKHYFDYLTLEYYAESIKSQFLIANTVLDSNDNKIFSFNNIDNIDITLLEKILNCIHDNNLGIDKIKKIARSEIWRSFWGISKENIFEGKVKDWTDEQRSLVNFSKVLDSVREHMESPSEEVIADDDALDGWILYQHEKNEKEKTKKTLLDKYGLDKKEGDEVFVLTRDKEENKRIFELNDKVANKDIDTMIKIANEKTEEIKWGELPHVQRKIKQQIMEMNKHELQR